MGAVGVILRGIRAARPLVETVQRAESGSREGGHLSVLPGEALGTERLRELLGVRGASPAEDGLAVVAATPGADLGAARTILARRRHAGGGALAVLVGTRGQRAEMERELLAGHELEPSSLAHVASLDGPGGRAAIGAVVGALGDEALAAGRRHPTLRPLIAQRMIRGAARQAGTVSALPLGSADMPVLTLLQVRLVASLAALHDRPFGAERALEAAAVVGAGFGWRAVGRSAVGLVPVAGWAARGAVAYAATRAVGEAAHARLSAGQDLIGGRPVDAVRPAVDRVLARLGRA